MFQARQADVIVPVRRDTIGVLRCLRSVLEHSGSALGRLIVIEDNSPEPELAETLQRLARLDSRVVLFRNTSTLGMTGSFNRGLNARDKDAVLLHPACVVTPGWLGELAAVAHAEERTACSAPLSNRALAATLGDRANEAFVDEINEDTALAACALLPRWTIIPVLDGLCLYLRGDVIDAIGLLDPGLSSEYASAYDWVMRAQMLGFVAKRANRVYIHHSSRPVSLDENEESPDFVDHADEHAVGERYPHLKTQLEHFQQTLEGPLAAHAVHLEVSGKLRVAYDIRHLPMEQVGTRTYAVNLAMALAKLPEIELTLLVRHPAQAEGLEGRVVTPEQWADDVAVIHKTAQVFDPHELKIAFESSAHLVVTYQDLIGFRIPVVFPTEDEANQYRATSRLTLPAVQKVLAYSERARQEIASEFAIPEEEIAVVALGAEAGWFARREPQDAAIYRKLKLPDRYFFSLATDFPHKNLPNLLEAYTLMRSRWRGSEPPGLVLAGYASGARTNFYRRLKANMVLNGLVFLGPVSPDELRVLYQHAEALVFPSLYEGFGLPPLEAMAAGTPVIAMPISSVPEVGGDCVLYPDGLSVSDLARAMEAIATQPSLCEDLRERGKARVEEFRWEKTARATFEAYRSAVLQPSERSIHMRRQLREAILRWSEPRQHTPHLHTAVSVHHPIMAEPIGIKNALKVLNMAMHARVKRELRRFQPSPNRRSA